MNDGFRFALDAVAVAILAFGLYFPRYRRRDMIVALLGINVGVLAVTSVLARAEITAGLGLGLFGVLSIIRLRSDELDHEEIAYYFAALGIGMIGGVAVEPDWLMPALIVVILVALFIGDHPQLFGSHRHQSMLLDHAFTDERELREHVEELLGARVLRLRVKRVDLVDDTTSIDVRYVLAPSASTTDDAVGSRGRTDASLSS
ncbi:MAG: DUF4956 domain-containing protein [Actinomycetota bacterium]